MARVLAITPAAVPTLDELAADPTRAATLPPAALQGLLCRCLTLQTALMGALLTASARMAGASTEPDSLLGVAAAATRLGMSRDWLYRHARRLPFTVRNGRLLRFSSHGITRYIHARQGRLPA